MSIMKRKREYDQGKRYEFWPRVKGYGEKAKRLRRKGTEKKVCV